MSSVFKTFYSSRAEQDIVKKTAMIYRQVEIDNEIIKLQSEYLLKQYKTLAQKTAERKDKIEHIRTIFKKVDQTAAVESLATAASSYVSVVVVVPVC